MNLETALRLQLSVADEENERLRQKVAALETMYAAKYQPADAWGLSRGEHRLFTVLAANRIATHAQLLLALEYEPFRHDQAASAESVKTLCNRLKRKLEPFGMSVDNVWGLGYTLKGNVK